jgi:hypothetical protein
VEVTTFKSIFNKILEINGINRILFVVLHLPQIDAAILSKNVSDHVPESTALNMVTLVRDEP